MAGGGSYINLWGTGSSRSLNIINCYSLGNQAGTIHYSLILQQHYLQAFIKVIVYTPDWI